MSEERQKGWRDRQDFRDSAVARDPPERTDQGASDEPPTFATSFLGDQREQAAGLLIRERKQREVLAPVKRGDDPRRPTAESSAAGVEQNRTRELKAGSWGFYHCCKT